MEYVKYCPLVLFTLFVLKLMVFGAAFADMGALAVIGAVAAFYEFKTDERRYKVLDARFAEVDKHLTQVYKENKELKDSIGAIKLGSNMRSVSVGHNR